MVDRQTLIPTERRRPTRRPWFSRWQWWAWGTGWLASLFVLVFLHLFQPETTIPLGPAVGETYLPGINSFVDIRREDFGPLAGDGQSQSLAPGANMRIAAYSYRPIVLQ